LRTSSPTDEIVRSEFCSKSGTPNTSAERRAMPMPPTPELWSVPVRSPQLPDGRLRYQAKYAQLSDEVQRLQQRLKEQIRSVLLKFGIRNSKKTD
jgi:hypothetical protein